MGWSVMMAFHASTHERLTGRRQRSLMAVAPLPERDRLLWLMQFRGEHGLWPYESPLDDDSERQEVNAKCASVMAALKERGWQDQKVERAGEELRRQLVEELNARPPRTSRLTPDACEIARAVWQQDQRAELLVLRGLDVRNLRNIFDDFPRASVCPATDPRWFEQILPDIRYGVEVRP